MNNKHTTTLEQTNENPIPQKDSHLSPVYINAITKIVTAGILGCAVLGINDSFQTKGNINNAIPVLDKLITSFVGLASSKI